MNSRKNFKFPEKHDDYLSSMLPALFVGGIISITDHLIFANTEKWIGTSIIGLAFLVLVYFLLKALILKATKNGKFNYDVGFFVTLVTSLIIVIIQHLYDKWTLRGIISVILVGALLIFALTALTQKLKR